MTDVMDDAHARRRLRAIAASGARIETTGRAGGVAWHVWGNGPALVLLHGGSGSWNHWIHTIPAFANGCRVLAADTPGIGDSPTPSEPHTIEGVAEIVSEGIDELVPDETRFDLVGFSFGGLVGGQVALLQPHRVRSLTIVGSPPFGLAVCRTEQTASHAPSHQRPSNAVSSVGLDYVCCLPVVFSPPSTAW